MELRVGTGAAGFEKDLPLFSFNGYRMFRKVLAEGIANMWMSKKHRERARAIACDCWVQSAFNEQRAIGLTKEAVASDKVQGVYGNPLVAIMIAYYVAAMCYLAYKVWRENHVKHPPGTPVAGEPFGLDGG